ncbi:MAG: bifunctional nuclease domain-containing protein [Bacteroidota bacterium]|mgnify:CR=1 FL=1
MRKIALDIIALSHSVTQSNNYAVVLGERDGARRLPIVIGGFEAQAIAVAIEGMLPNRPLTHDLFKNTLDIFNVELKEIIINNLLEGIFYARLVCVKDGEIIEIDSRTSDALALAVRFTCPIYTYEFILDAAGVELQEGGEDEDEEEVVEVEGTETYQGSEPEFSRMTVEQLKTALNEVLAAEDYESAAKIRDEINKRK